MTSGINRFTVEFSFNASRERFGEKLHVHLLVWDEIRNENILITTDENYPSDLTLPGERLVSFRIVKVENVIFKTEEPSEESDSPSE